MGKDFKVKVYDKTERADVFMKVFGRSEVCVKSFIPELVSLDGVEHQQLAYMLDLNEIAPDEREKLVKYLSEKFNLDPAYVDSQLDERGVPILASECTLTVENPGKWIDLNDDMNLTELDRVFSEWDDDDYEDDDEWDDWD